MSEWEIQKATAMRLAYRRDLVAWHTPNGAYHGGNVMAGVQSKRAGVLPGVSDWIVLRRDKPPLAWEIKDTNGKLSSAQKKYLKAVEGYGWETLVTFGMDDAMKALERI